MNRPTDMRLVFFSRASCGHSALFLALLLALFSADIPAAETKVPAQPAAATDSASAPAHTSASEPAHAPAPEHVSEESAASSAIPAPAAETPAPEHAQTLPRLNLSSVVWRAIANEKGRAIEVDSASVQNYAPGKVLATTRLILDKEIVDVKSSGSYKFILTNQRYDCEARNAATLKRVFVTADNGLLREENMPESPAMPVRSNSLENKVMRELCRPQGRQATVAAAEGAAKLLRQSNEVVIHKQLAAIRAAVGKPENVNKSVAVNTRRQSSAGKAVSQKTSQEPPKNPPHQPPALQPPTPEHLPPQNPPHQQPPAPEHPLPPPEWSYGGAGGPAHWGDLKPENRLCKEGKRQSPIDIRDGMELDLEPIAFDYRETPFTLTDTGRGIEVETQGDLVTLSGKDYYLERVTFQYPAEERINGRIFIMGAHLEHRAADGERLNIAVLLERGEANRVVQSIWNHLPLEKNRSVSPEAEIDLSALLPRELGYHTYMGSVTRPPCEEDVTWIVLQTPISVSVDQEEILARLYPSLARPIQPVEGRRIKSSLRR